LDAIGLQALDKRGKTIMDAITGTTDTQNFQQRRPWRDVLAVHPAAELFPLMSEADLSELADDIDKGDLREPVDLYHDPETLTDCVLDGRNRLDALERLGQEICDDNGYPAVDVFRRVGHDVPFFDPYAYVISKNLHRRHLTSEQKRDLIAKLLKANPEKSNRQIAAAVGVDHKTVTVVRAESVATGEIPQLDKTTGRDGRARPARMTKPTPSASAPEAPTPSTSESSTSAPSEAKPDAVVADADTSAVALANFKYACTHWLPKLSQEDRAEALKFAASTASEAAP